MHYIEAIQTSRCLHCLLCPHSRILIASSNGSAQLAASTWSSGQSKLRLYIRGTCLWQPATFKRTCLEVTWRAICVIIAGFLAARSQFSRAGAGVSSVAARRRVRLPRWRVWTGKRRDWLVPSKESTCSNVQRQTRPVRCIYSALDFLRPYTAASGSSVYCGTSILSSCSRRAASKSAAHKAELTAAVNRNSMLNGGTSCKNR